MGPCRGSCGLALPAEPAIDGVPAPVFRRHVVPRRAAPEPPEYAVDDRAVLIGRSISAPVLALDRQHVLQDAPFRLGEIASAQACLQKAALNQSYGASSIRSTEAGFAGVRRRWYLRLMEHRPGYNALMHEVCVERGWCGGGVDGNPSHVDDLIPEHGSVTADRFVDRLFHGGRYGSECRDAFIRHMGHDTVDASSPAWATD